MPQRDGAGELAAEIAVVLTERGLGGNDVDLDAPARPVPPRPFAARRGARAVWRSAGRSRSAATRRARLPRTSSPSTGVLLALAYPDRVAQNRGGGRRFVLANGRGAAVDRLGAGARAVLAVAELAGTAAQGRILLAAPITQAEIEARFADRIESARGDRVRSRRDGAARRAAGGGSARSRCRKRRSRCQPSAETARDAGRWHWSPPASTGCPGRKPLKQWRDRVMFLRKAEGDEWPDLSDAALAASARTGWRRALHDKTALKELSAPTISRTR